MKYKYQLKIGNNVIFGEIEECSFMHAVTTVSDIALEMGAQIMSICAVYKQEVVI